MAIFRIRKDRFGKPRYQRIIRVMHNGKLISASKTYSSKRKALRWEREFYANLSKGIVSRGGSQSKRVCDAIQRYCEQLIADNEKCKVKNLRNILQQLNWWKKEIGEIWLCRLSPQILTDCRNRLENGDTVSGKKRSPTTVLKYLSAFSVVLDAAEKDWAWIPQNYMRSVRKPAPAKGKTRFFSIEEIHKLDVLCKESNSPLLWPIFMVALHTGMRKSEILSLRFENLHFDRHEIYLPTSKNGQPRVIPMAEVVLKIFCALAKGSHVGSDFVFPAPTNQKKPVDIYEFMGTCSQQGKYFRRNFSHASAYSLYDSGQIGRSYGSGLSDCWSF
ncbi:MAG: intD [Parachlamydiales bacterium]|nr:intD [Parachlamydiales bacterium]